MHLNENHVNEILKKCPTSDALFVIMPNLLSYLDVVSDPTFETNWTMSSSAKDLPDGTIDVVSDI